jgi:signal transduction histidine kinase
MRPAQHLFDRLPLALQVLVAGGLATGLAAGLLLWHDAAAAAGWAAAGGLLATLLSAGLALRAARGLNDITRNARQLLREDASSQLQLPYKSASAELHSLSLALRRLVDSARARQHALEARSAALGLKLQSRTQELSSLQDLSIGLAQQGDINQLVNEALGALEQTIDYSSASVWARAGMQPQQPVVLMGYRSQEAEIAGLALDDLTGLRLSRSNLQRYEQIEADGQPIVENQPRQGLLSWLWEMVTDDARTSALYRNTRAWMAVPLQVRERVLGVLRVDHSQPGSFDPERVRLLSAVASQTALAMRHAHLLAQERDVAVMAERNRIARELHDAVSQTLFAANLLAGTLARDEGVDENTRVKAQTLEKLNRSALAEMRMLMFELRPDALASARLTELLQQAVEALAGRSDIQTSVQLESTEGPPPAQRIQIYRIAQEALSNIARHSGARHVHVGWTVPQSGHGKLRIADDGRGFDPATGKPGHFGLDNMRERACELGAQFMLSSAPGGGTEINLELSWEAG